MGFFGRITGREKLITNKKKIKKLLDEDLRRFRSKKRRRKFKSFMEGRGKDNGFG